MSNSAQKYELKLKTFKPSYGIEPLTEKFYARHDRISLDAPKPANLLYYEEEIEKLRKFDARYHWKVPRYTNQDYGWYPGSMVKFLQFCDSNLTRTPTMQEVARNLASQPIEGSRKLIDHCVCRERYARYAGWKIV